jgi:sugar phosphate permease
MEPSTVVLLFLAGVLLLAPSIRKALWKALRRLLRRLFASPVRGKGSMVFAIFWAMAIAIVILSAIPMVFSLAIATAGSWVWIFVPPLCVLLIKGLLRLRTRRRAPRKRALPRRRRFLRR